MPGPCGREVRGADSARASALAAALGVSPLLAQVLAARGLDDVLAARRFLTPELAELHAPDALPDFAAAVDRVCAALAGGERITVYGDYDVDGTTATAILVHFLRRVGGDVDYYVPHRVREGYGLQLPAVEALAARGTRLVVTVDCGTSSVAEIARAAALGMDVIVIDHHQTPERHPPAVALLNPHRRDSVFPERGLCSAGLAFYVAAGVRRRLRDGGAFGGGAGPNLKSYLDLVALGSIADVVPLLGLNRILVHHGLLLLSEPRRPGLAALKAVSGLEAGAVSSGQVAFRMAPRINAAGRVGDARRAVELMLCEDPARARALAEELDRENASRQEIERAVIEEAVEQALLLAGDAADGAVVVAREGWHPGVIGIVAARLAERFRRPAVVIALAGGVGKGSARTTAGVNLYEALRRCADHLLGFGGHAAAAGLSLREEEVAPFRGRFSAVVAEACAARGPAVRWADAEVEPAAVTLRVAEELERLRPFGEGNPEPVFVSRGVELIGARVVGAEHLRLQLAGTDAEAFGFRMAEHLPAEGARVDLCYHVRVDTWQGRRRLELHLCEAPRPLT